jgi:F-type H+-transporting ATPase subunit delta
MGEFIHNPHQHETVFDVGVERLATVYAKAALDAAGKAAAQDELMAELEDLRDNVLKREPRVQEMFASRLISEDDKLAMIDRVFAGRVSPLLLNVLKVLNKHRRLGMLRDVIAAMRKLWETRSGRQPVVLETANPLTPELEHEILKSLEHVLGRDPIVSASVNPELIAGFVIRVGDRVYDGSVRTRLEAMRKGMVARATEAIQTAPQRFFSNEAPAG